MPPEEKVANTAILSPHVVFSSLNKNNDVWIILYRIKAYHA